MISKIRKFIDSSNRYSYTGTRLRFLNEAPADPNKFGERCIRLVERRVIERGGHETSPREALIELFEHQVVDLHTLHAGLHLIVSTENVKNVKLVIVRRTYRVIHRIYIIKSYEYGN